MVSRRDGCTNGENPLLKDGGFLEGMRFPARDWWLIVFIKFLYQEVWRRVRRMGGFPWRRFPNEEF